MAWQVLQNRTRSFFERTVLSCVRFLGSCALLGLTMTTGSQECRLFVALNSAPSGRRCSLLETDMTETLCTLWQTEEQRQRLVAEHLPQVRHIASRMYQHLPRHISYEDLVSAGVLGLIDAVEK